MSAKHMPESHGSATGKPTDLTPKSGEHAIESEHTEDRGPIKAGRNMGGRNLLGERTHSEQKKPRRNAKG